LGLGGREGGLGVGGGGVDDGARRQHHGEGRDGVVGVLGDGAAHAPGVVGDDPAQGAGASARRVGTKLAAIASQHGVGVRQDQASTDAQRLSVGLYFSAGLVAAVVDPGVLEVGVTIL